MKTLDCAPAAATARTVALTMALLGFAGLAAAQQPTHDQVAAIKSSCHSDYMSYCMGVPRGGAEALQCLKKNVASLSASCQQAVKAASGGTANAPAPAKAAVPAAEQAPPKTEPAAAAATPVPPPAPAAANPVTPSAAVPAASAVAPTSGVAATAPSPAPAEKSASVPAAPAPSSPPPATAKAVAPVPASPTASAEPAAPAAAPSGPALPPVTGFIPPRKKLVLMRACNAELKAFCSEVAFGGGRAIGCLQANAASLSPGCRETLANLAQ
jgi:hypothetical protein